MATVVTKSLGTINVKTMDANVDLGKTYFVTGINFYPGAANDILMIKSVNDSGQVVVQMIALTAGQENIYPNCWMHPYIDYTNSTITAGTIVNFYVRGRSEAP